MTRKLLLSALILFPLLTIAQPNPKIRAFEAEKLYMEGLKKFQQRQFRDAIDVFDRVVDLDAEHANAYEARGDAYYQLKNYKRALNDYEAALDLNPDNANLWNNAGVAAGDEGLFRAAANYFYEAIQIDPKHADANDNYQEARRIMDREGIAYTEPRRPSIRDKYEDDYPKDPYDDPYYGEGSSSGSSSSSGGYSSGGYNSGYDDYDNGGYSNSSGTTRPSKYEVTRPGQNGKGKGRNNSFKDGTRTRDQEYTFKSSDIKLGPRTDIQLKVDQVRITKNSTMLTFILKNTGDKSFPIKLATRTSKDAWYLTDRSFDEVYRLKTIKNIDGWNKGKSFNLKPRGTHMFIAEFDRLDNDVTYFHLLEGKKIKPGAWNIYDIQLIRK